MRISRAAIVVVSLASAAASALAQPPATRAEALRQQREQKQQALRPNEPDTLQRAMNTVEDRALLLAARDGFHPKLGSLATGSGFAFGVGFRNRDVFAKRGTLELFTATSARKYWAIEARALFSELARHRVFAEGVASLRESPREDFFGIGAESRRDDHSNFLLRTARISGRAGLRLTRSVSLGGGLEYLTPRVGRGRDERLPSIEQLFDIGSVPGLGPSTDFVRSSALVEIDYRQPKNARQGGWYRVEMSRFSDRQGGRFTFNRTDVDLRQFIGFLAGRRVIALRGSVSASDVPADAAGVPFYLMPSLGGNDTLRGFRNYRFRGPHALLLQAEYRWEIWSGFEGAFFYDAGKVVLDRTDLNFMGLQDDYGLGFRFNTDNGVVMRIDAAFGSRDGKHLHIVFGGVF